MRRHTRAHWRSTYEVEQPWCVWELGRTHDVWWPIWTSTRLLGRARVGATCMVCGHREVITLRIPRFGPVPEPASGRHRARQRFLDEHAHPDRGAPMSWALPLLNMAVHPGGLNLDALAMRLEADINLRLVSYGGGVQSTALLVLAAQRRIDFPLFVFANVGDDSENPATIDYVRERAQPFADQHGVELVERERILRDGSRRTLLAEIRTSDRSIPIPARMGSGGFGRKRCTDRYKIAVVRREAKRRGANADAPATVAIGISTDEIDRAGAGPGPDPRDPTRNVEYPLLDLGISRRDCVRIIADAGLPIPPKSACVFCPLHDREAWRRIRRNPDEWATAVEVDDIVRTRARALGRGDMGLVSPTIPLADAVDDQLALFGDGCSSGWCMT